MTSAVRSPIGPGLFLVDVTLTYRHSRGRVADMWALQVKNALAAKETILDYNFQTNQVEEVKEGSRCRS